MLVIIALALFWYGLVPVAGAFVSRQSWRFFRRRFDNLRLKPILNYPLYYSAQSGEYRFLGVLEAITDDQILWVRGNNLTVPVSLRNVHTYLMPIGEAGNDFFEPGKDTPVRIKWSAISTLTGEAKVFVGGPLVRRDDRWVFESTRENPLIVIFYDGGDRFLTVQAIRAGRQRNEYWNAVTPYSFILGAFCLIVMASSFLLRPAFRLTALTAFITVFTPIVSMIPPGLLFTMLYRKFWLSALRYRSYRDLARLPLKYFTMPLSSGVNKKKRIVPENDSEQVLCSCRLPNGERYGIWRRKVLPQAARDQGIPLLIPEHKKRKKEGWYLFGALPEPKEAGKQTADIPADVPAAPDDVCAVYGALPGNPEVLAARFALKAHILEALAVLSFCAGMALNIYFIRLIVMLFF
ncbi:MAG: hypothetical protein LBP76_01990 [Treponema sp.]|nr:hypothetical protein [Treponema sp.]